MHSGDVIHLQLRPLGGAKTITVSSAQRGGEGINLRQER